MGTRADTLYFVAGRTLDATRGPHCLVRVHTPLGVPHVACVGRALGERWIDLMSVAGQACLVSEHELTHEIAFDVESYGVLVFEDHAALDAYVIDADNFDYASRIRRPVIGVESLEPW